MADTGKNLRHTVRVLERAGADGIQLEDQAAPKRCGHFTGKATIRRTATGPKLAATRGG